MRILAVEEGGFPEAIPGERKGQALLVGVITSDFAVERVLFSKIEVDGLNATRKLVKMVLESRENIDLILLASISYGGFNLINPREVYEKLAIPVIVANPKKPDNLAVESALLHHFPDWEKRLKIIKGLREPKELTLNRERKIYFHVIGMDEKQAEELIREEICFGKRLEPLRIAHILAHEISKNHYKTSREVK